MSSPAENPSSAEVPDEDWEAVADDPQDGESLFGTEEGDLPVELTPPGVLIEKNDRSLSELHRWWRAGRLILDPDWQRHYVWDRKRASRLIESILIDVPIPVIYLAKTEDGKYEVIDGLQRLTSTFDFFDNKYALRHLEILRDHNKNTFNKLPEQIQNKLLDSTLRTFELSPQTSKDLMFLIFECLNTGGQALNEMEIRNSLYRGELNQLIKKLAGHEDFLRALSQPQISKRMADRGLVLRFLAFYERTHLRSRSGLKKFLNEFLDIYRNPPQSKLREFEDAFTRAMRASVTVFGETAFRLFADGDGSSGGWASRANASIFQVVATSFAQYDLGQLTRAADSIYEEYIDLVSTDARWRDCVRRATGEATRIDYVFGTWNSRLAAVLDSIDPNDNQRCFTRQLKIELWNQDKSCPLCGNAIKLIDDAALDHELQYWRGGQTVPENARLVHRLCNAKRPN